MKPYGVEALRHRVEVADRKERRRQARKAERQRVRRELAVGRGEFVLPTVVR